MKRLTETATHRQAATENSYLYDAPHTVGIPRCRRHARRAGAPDPALPRPRRLGFCGCTCPRSQPAAGARDPRGLAAAQRAPSSWRGRRDEERRAGAARRRSGRRAGAGGRGGRWARARPGRRHGRRRHRRPALGLLAHAACGVVTERTRLALPGRPSATCPSRSPPSSWRASSPTASAPTWRSPAPRSPAPSRHPRPRDAHHRVAGAAARRGRLAQWMSARRGGGAATARRLVDETCVAPPAAAAGLDDSHALRFAAEIGECFGQPSLAAVAAALEGGGAWHAQALQRLKASSPLASFELLRRAAAADDWREVATLEVGRRRRCAPPTSARGSTSCAPRSARPRRRARRRRRRGGGRRRRRRAAVAAVGRASRGGRRRSPPACVTRDVVSANEKKYFENTRKRLDALKV